MVNINNLFSHRVIFSYRFVIVHHAENVCHLHFLLAIAFRDLSSVTDVGTRYPTTVVEMLHGIKLIINMYESIIIWF